MDKEEIIKKIKYLEEERIKLWERIVQQDNELSRKISDDEKEAKQASKKASEYKNRSEESKLKIDEYHQISFELKNEIISFHKSIKALNDKTTQIHDSSLEKNGKSEEYLKKIETDLENFQENIEELNSIFEGFDDLTNKIKSLDDINTNAEDLVSKIDSLYKNSISRKREIDLLHRDIIGYDEKDETTGEITHIDGIKDELENTYQNIESNFDILNAKILESKEQLITDYKTIAEEKELQFNTTINNWELKYSNLEKRITDLLPKALSTGLSYAYAEKKEIEVAESEKISKKFDSAIMGLVLISLIPFAISVKSICEDENLIDVIYRMPRLVLSILPLYIPILWIAYSSSKKLNLSKRLIEEYTHKEVLSKTFEGLSKQINNLEDTEITKDLKNKLLYNILEISSENPGKLISDYNKSDHPLMDALDKSVQLANSVDKLSNLPGIKKLTSILDKRATEIIKVNDTKANNGLDNIEEKDSENEEK